MKLFDRIFLDDPGAAAEFSPHYGEYRTGAQRVSVGMAAIIGGLVFNALTGGDAGIDVGMAGVIVTYWGGAQFASNADRINRETMDM